MKKLHLDCQVLAERIYADLFEQPSDSEDPVQNLIRKALTRTIIEWVDETFIQPTLEEKVE